MNAPTGTGALPHADHLAAIRSLSRRAQEKLCKVATTSGMAQQAARDDYQLLCGRIVAHIATLERDGILERVQEALALEATA